MTSQRYERKVPLNAQQFHDFLFWHRLHGSCFRKSYAPRPVHSLYLDDLHLGNLWSNLSGESKRHKYRLRWYQSTDDVQFEVKQRFNALGDKTVVQLGRFDVYNVEFVKVLSDLRSCLKEHSLYLPDKVMPTAYIQYQRSYYEDFFGNRMTVDTDILQKDLQTKSYLTPSYDRSQHCAVVEFKFAKKQYSHVQTALAHLPFRFDKNSKYVNTFAGDNFVLD